MAKRKLNEVEKAECATLKEIYSRKKSDLNLSQQKIADALGVSQGAVNHYLNGINSLNASVASSFAKILGVSVDDFSSRLALEINSMAIGVDAELLNSFRRASADTTVINLYDISASCGGGYVNPEFPELLRSIEIPNSALIELLGTTNLDGVMLMQPDGDSMEPTIPRRSAVLIKTNVNDFKNSGVYLITFDGYTYIRRLARGKGGVLFVTSDNEAYRQTDFQITPDEVEKLFVHGQFWKVLPLDFLDV